jgi:uncharacterized Tic20 family protein
MDTLDQEWDNAPTPNETQISMWAHLIGIISCMSSLLGIIGTFIFYMINKDKNPFVKQHVTRALNFQITYFICSALITVVVLAFLVGSFINSASLDINELMEGSIFSIIKSIGLSLFLYVAVLITNLFCCIRSAIAANKGEIWHNPVSFSLIKL